MAYKIRRKKKSVRIVETIIWDTKFPKEKVIKSFKKMKGRNPIQQELDFIKEAKYFNPQEW